MHQSRRGLCWAFSFLAVGMLVFGADVRKADAVPSYARQTGLACNGCHTNPPELNAAGRRFKLLGYTDRAQDTATVSNEPGKKHSGLDLLKSLPLSVMFDTSFTSTNTPQQGTQNGTFEFPQQASLFLAGGFSAHLGSFIQVTYTAQDNHFGMDNAEVRYANTTKLGGKDLVYGFTINNNPTVEDLWNSTPVWGYPWISSASAPTPTAAPIIQSLGQDVAGLGGYGMWSEHLYLAAAIYRTDHIGSPQPNSGEGFGINIRGVAPYWRAAWQQSFGSDTYLEVGTFGMHVDSTPNGVVGLQDTFTDWAVDAQLDQTLFVRDVLSIRASYTHESSNLAATLDQGGAAAAGHTLKSVAVNAGYHFGNQVSATLGWFDVTGTADPQLFPPGALSGSANGSPNSTGYIANLSWWPIQNAQLGVQYTAYTRFNGAGTNYDGAGRNASANNTFYVLARFIF